jgi:hypothetical protein
MNYSPSSRVTDIRLKRTQNTQKLSPPRVEQQYELSFDIASDAHLRTLLREENKSSLSDFINS